MYQNIHKLLCISNDVFVTYQIQGWGVSPEPPLRTPLFQSVALVSSRNSYTYLYAAKLQCRHTADSDYIGNSPETVFRLRGL